MSPSRPKAAIYAMLASSLCSLMLGCNNRSEIVAGKPVRQWTSQLNDRDPVTRQLAVRALGELGPRGESFAPLLAKKLTDQDSQTRVQAVKSLQRIANGSYSSRAVIELTAALKVDDPYRLRDRILDALAKISRFDSLKKSPRAGWFGVFPCRPHLPFQLPVVSHNHKSYRQQVTAREMGDMLYEDTDYILARDPQFARMDGSDLLLKVCPKATRGRNSLDNVGNFTNANSLPGLSWRGAAAQQSGGYCAVSRLQSDALWIEDSLTGFHEMGNMTAMNRKAAAAMSPPRVDFSRSLEEFTVLTSDTTPCDVEVWAGEPDFSQRDQSGEFKTMVYDLPDTSQVTLSFKKSDPSLQESKSYLFNVSHSFEDLWMTWDADTIPLKQDH